jgi:hypothetical protein
MTQPPKQPVADIIDVHILDLAAQIEALLRGVREIQRGVLRVRGAVPPAPGVEPAKDLQDQFANMLRVCDALRDAVESGAETAARLTSAQSKVEDSDVSAGSAMPDAG